MRRHLVLLLSSASLFASLALLPETAAARPVRHARPARATHYPAPPLTVHRRSFLDPGNVVPVGTTANYVNDSTIYNRTPDQIGQRSKFGNEALPGRFDLPGRPEPIIEFSTGPGGE